jgi:hypothetical protein
MSNKTTTAGGTGISGKDLPAAKSGEFRIGGDLPVWRLGFGAMRITGKGIWGEPKDHDEAIRVLRRAVELRINLRASCERTPDSGSATSLSGGVGDRDESWI